VLFGHDDDEFATSACSYQFVSSSSCICLVAARFAAGVLLTDPIDRQSQVGWQSLAESDAFDAQS
jgi:hypothetical protein